MQVCKSLTENCLLLPLSCLPGDLPLHSSLAWPALRCTLPPRALERCLAQFSLLLQLLYHSTVLCSTLCSFLHLRRIIVYDISLECDLFLCPWLVVTPLPLPCSLTIQWLSMTVRSRLTLAPRICAPFFSRGGRSVILMSCFTHPAMSFFSLPSGGLINPQINAAYPSLYIITSAGEGRLPSHLSDIFSSALVLESASPALCSSFHIRCFRSVTGASSLDNEALVSVNNSWFSLLNSLNSWRISAAFMMPSFPLALTWEDGSPFLSLTSFF